MQQSDTEIAEVKKDGLVPLESESPRILAFDFARGIAIIAMVAIHSIVFLGDPDLPNTVTGYIANSIICLLAAPVFTFVMGVMLSFSKQATPLKLIIRGLTILGIGYFLNLLRGTVPITVGQFTGWVESTNENPLSFMLEDDILQFAGIAFVIIGFLVRIIPSKVALAIIGFVTMFIAPYIFSTVPVRHNFTGYFISLLIGGHHYNFFPVIPWISFPLIGMYYGELLKRKEDKKRFFAISMVIGLSIIIAGIVLGICVNQEIFHRWYTGTFRQGRLEPLASILFTGFLLLWIPLCYFAVDYLKSTVWINPLLFWSKNVTWFYVIQWIIIGWVCVFIPYLSWSLVLFACAGIIVLTHGTIFMFAKK